jgi:SsrA-binding protein
VFLVDAHISPYTAGNRFNVEPLRRRKLLLHRREIRKFNAKVKEKGLTLVPTKVYFKHGMVKVEIALARGKKIHDKREAIQARDAARDTRRSLRR